MGSPERFFIKSPEDTNLFASIVGEHGGYIITAHRIGNNTYYNLWERKEDGTNERVSVEEKRKGLPEREVFRDILIEIIFSTPDNPSLRRLLEAVTQDLN